MHRVADWIVPGTIPDSEHGLGILPMDERRRHDVPAVPAGHNARIAWATWAFVALGLIVRLVRYLVVYPIWHDEAFVAVNFLDRGYLDLVRPLDYYQVCPILFLWIELTAVRLLGFSEIALRLFPSICGLVSVLAFRHLAGRLLKGLPLLLAVAVFATAFYPIRHSAEVKPYASDLLASLILLSLAVEWLRAPGRSLMWWALSLCVPVLLALSYPSIFVAAGIVIALGPEAVRSEYRSVRLGFVAYLSILIASFLGLYVTFTVVQSDALQAAYRWGFWRDSFPPWDRPWDVPVWLIGVHSGTTLAYPIGGERGASAGTLVAVAVGILALWRRGRRTQLSLLLAPCVMGLAAASLGQYPYGGAPRITQYLAPSICLLTGVGTAVLLGRIPSRRWRDRGLGLTIGLLATLGVFLVVRDLARPYRVRGDVTSRTFARWLWNEYRPDADLVCVKSDLGLAFQPEIWKTGMSAVYLFHRGASAQRKAVRSSAERLTLLSGKRPVRLVFFDAVPAGNPTYERWLSRVGECYRVGKCREFVVSAGKPDERWLRERYVVLELEPKAMPIERRAEASPVARARPVPQSGRSGSALSSPPDVIRK